jgi:uncharacterized membrane protein
MDLTALTKHIVPLLITLMGIVMLFLPGLAVSYLFFYKRTITHLERFVISLSLSLVLLPLLVFYTSLFGLRFTQLSAGITLSVLTVCATLTAFILHKTKHHE